jgi:lysophospholipase L1-like esterase
MMQKEQYEWIQSWCDEADKDDKPRVLLIGDSITYGYQAIVRELLKDFCYVDYLATSYAADNKLYSTLVESFAKNSRYFAVHFNHGLHGVQMCPRTYKSKIKNLLLRLQENSKIILAESTIVLREGNRKQDPVWRKRVSERNDVVAELVTELDCEWDRLYSVSEKIPLSARKADGVHYEAAGYEMLADSVAKSILKILK